ncbi:isocitrate lyase/phosphoenolpyruvate mutase family protein [Streptomyces sp. NPDC047108]|uniref:isocitrate lyase/PEP mutase family protein n=1 Tax=Streptomyces sp. NPDC047108 TaxID=3155025 RepID=UPI003405E553
MTMAHPRTPNDKARLLRSLHDGDHPLVLPNAWDAAGAALIAGAGARAVATTSGGVAWSLGRADGQQLTRREAADAVRRIAGAVDVPVTADIEGGYGPGPEDVAATVRAVLDAGAVGVNLEDSQAPGGPLFDAEAQAGRIRAAREAATASGVPDLVINARTDVFLFAVGDPADRLDAVRRRARAYVKAGADCLFVPGLLDLAALEGLAKDLPVPVNAMAVPGGPAIADLAAAGVRRISVGTTLAQVAYGAVRRAAAELVTSGTFDGCEGALEFPEANSLFDRPGR